MFDFFEQPWTLTGVAILVLFGVLTFRSVWPEKNHWWQWLLPVFVASIAFGLDALVKTDLEKVNAVIKVTMKAVQQKDINAIEAVIADNYYDSYHNNKEHLIADCRKYLSQNPVKKIKKTSIQKRYKSSEGDWKATHSLDKNDIPKMILALSKAYEYLTMGDDSANNKSAEEP